MQSPAETIQRIREYIFDNSLDLHIRYLLVTNEEHPSEYARYNLHRMLHARRLSVLVFKGAVNRALGEASPYANDPELIGRDYQQDHEDWVEFRILRNPPRKRRAETGNRYRKQNTGMSGVASATGSVPQPACGSCNENDITRRGEDGEGHKQLMSANAEKMREILRRVDEWLAQQKPRRERRGSPPMAATTSTETAPEPDTSQSVRPGSPEPVRPAPVLHDPVVELTPGNEQHVAAESPRPPACQPGLLLIRHCGPTPGCAAVPTSPRLRRTRPSAWRTGSPRSHYDAGPGGACLRAAA